MKMGDMEKRPKLKIVQKDDEKVGRRIAKYERDRSWRPKKKAENIPGNTTRMTRGQSNLIRKQSDLVSSVKTNKIDLSTNTKSTLKSGKNVSYKHKPSAQVLNTPHSVKSKSWCPKRTAWRRNLSEKNRLLQLNRIRPLKVCKKKKCQVSCADDSNKIKRGIKKTFQSLSEAYDGEKAELQSSKAKPIRKRYRSNQNMSLIDRKKMMEKPKIVCKIKIDQMGKEKCLNGNNNYTKEYIRVRSVGKSGHMRENNNINVKLEKAQNVLQSTLYQSALPSKYYADQFSHVIVPRINIITGNISKNCKLEVFYGRRELVKPKKKINQIILPEVPIPFYEDLYPSSNLNMPCLECEELSVIEPSQLFKFFIYVTFFSGCIRIVFNRVFIDGKEDFHEVLYEHQPPIYINPFLQWNVGRCLQYSLLRKQFNETVSKPEYRKYLSKLYDFPGRTDLDVVLDKIDENILYESCEDDENSGKLKLNESDNGGNIVPNEENAFKTFGHENIERGNEKELIIHSEVKDVDSSVSCHPLSSLVDSKLYRMWSETNPLGFENFLPGQNIQKDSPQEKKVFLDRIGHTAMYKHVEEPLETVPNKLSRLVHGKDYTLPEYLNISSETTPQNVCMRNIRSSPDLYLSPRLRHNQNKRNSDLVTHLFKYNSDDQLYYSTPTSDKKRKNFMSKQKTNCNLVLKKKIKFPRTSKLKQLKNSQYKCLRCKQNLLKFDGIHMICKHCNLVYSD